MENYIELCIYLASMCLTWFLGYLSKKSTWVNNNFIPIQNVAIGAATGLIYYLFTKDYKFALELATSGIMAGGSYDIFHGKNKIKEANEEYKETDEKIGE